MAEKSKPVITNAMRLLKQGHVDFEAKYYDLGDEPFSGEAVTRLLGLEEARSFKTLCAKGERKGIAVFVVPIAMELDLKKAAKALSDKAVALVAVKDLLAIAGYERGSVSPIGMKRRYPVFIEESALQFATIGVSGGMKGVTLMVEPNALAKYLGAAFAPLGEEKGESGT